MSTEKLIQSEGPGLLRQGLAAAPMPVLKLLARVIVRYVRQRQRHDLAQLDDRMLRDIGITRIDAEREAYKPFWRD
jgi:uncharacterized protein YjiS (DUF1127 family)